MKYSRYIGFGYTDTSVSPYGKSLLRWYWHVICNVNLINCISTIFLKFIIIFSSRLYFIPGGSSIIHIICIYWAGCVSLAVNSLNVSLERISNIITLRKNYLNPPSRIHLPFFPILHDELCFTVTPVHFLAFLAVSLPAGKPALKRFVYRKGGKKPKGERLPIMCRILKFQSTV